MVICDTSSPSRNVSGPGSKETSRDVEPPSSPAWLPTTHDSTRTYARRVRQAHLQEAYSPEHSILPSPFIRRTLQRTSGRVEHDATEYACKNRARRENRAAKSRRLPIRPVSSAEEAAKNLMTAFETFLTGTRPATAIRRLGASRLSETCLRRLPVLLEAEQNALDIQSDLNEISDLAFEVYTDLENLGTRRNGGWSGLRQTVRSHGLYKISQAARSGALPFSLVDSLVDICSKHSAFPEARILLEAIPESHWISSRAKFDKVLTLWEALDCNDWCLEQVTRDLLSYKLSVRDITQTPRIWQILIKYIHDSGDQERILQFLRACLERTPHRALSLAFHTVFPLLTAMAVHSSLNHLESDISTSASILISLATMTSAQPSCEPQGSNATSTSKLHIDLDVACIILDCLRITQAKSIVQSSTLWHADALTAAFADVRRESSLRKSVSTFFANFTQHLERLKSDSSFGVLKDIVNGLNRVLPNQLAMPSVAFTKQLMLKSIMSFTEARTVQTASLIHDIEGLSCHPEPDEGDVSPSALCSNESICERYRWEDSICEWIQATPVQPQYPEADRKVVKVEDRTAIFVREVSQSPCTRVLPKDIASSPPQSRSFGPSRSKRRFQTMATCEEDESRYPRLTRLPLVKVSCNMVSRSEQRGSSGRRHDTKLKPSTSRPRQARDENEDELLRATPLLKKHRIRRKTTSIELKGWHTADLLTDKRDHSSGDELSTYM